jgi:hypothetical protein
MERKNTGFTIGQILGGLLVSFIAGGGLSGYSIYQHFFDKIENSSRKIGELEEILKIKEKIIANSEIELLKIKSESTKLKSELNIVTQKWRKCISPGVTTAVLETIDTDAHETRLKTKDRIEIQFTSSSFFLEIVRVTEDGPIVEISGCKNFIFTNGKRSVDDGESAFQLPLKKKFIIKYSRETCKGGLFSDSEAKEELIIFLENYNVDEQSLHLKYWKK